MKIGMWSDSHNFPSLPLMKISAYHRNKNDTVEIYRHSTEYDIVYISKVFTESLEPVIDNAENIIKGGSGYDLENKLPWNIEHIYPDYSLYPQFKFALGWLTRGCPCKNHTFCITPQKDGLKSIKVAEISEFWNGQKNIVLLDQNLLACKDSFELLEQLTETGAWVDFTGGLDIRFIDNSIINVFKKMKVKGYHFAWDNPREDLYDKFKFFAYKRLKSPDSVTVYVLVNYWSSHEEDLMRVYKLRELGLMPYVMIYDKQKYVDSRGRWLHDVYDRYTTEQLQHFKTCQHLQRWCNTRRLIKIVPRFEDYDSYKNWLRKGKQCGVML